MILKPISMLRAVDATISFLGSVTWDGAVGSTTVSLSSLGLEEDDLLICIECEGDYDIVPVAALPTGFTQHVLCDGNTCGNRYVTTRISYKFQGSTPDSNITFDYTTTNGRVSIVVLAFRGVDTSTPFDANASFAYNGTFTSMNPPAITVATDGSLVVAGGRSSKASFAEAQSWVAPSGYTLLDYEGSVSDTYGSFIIAASKEDVSAGSEDPGVFSPDFSSVGGYQGGFTFALRAA
jgi:hypothetical protein